MEGHFVYCICCKAMGLAGISGRAGPGNEAFWMKRMTDFDRDVYEAVKRIPEGCVATYGQIAELSGHPRAARAVGNALHRNTDPDVVPCFRVVSASGRMAPGFCFGGPFEQAKMLRAEGIKVVNLHVDLEEYQWKI